jgi:hypothetical protein
VELHGCKSRREGGCRISPECPVQIATEVNVRPRFDSRERPEMQDKREGRMPRNTSRPVLKFRIGSPIVRLTFDY